MNQPCAKVPIYSRLFDDKLSVRARENCRPRAISRRRMGKSAGGKAAAEIALLRARTTGDLVRTSQRIFRLISAMARRYDLTESQYNALRILRGAERRGEQLNQVDVSARLIASRANTTWILDRLEGASLILRRNHLDRRKKIVELTEAGRHLLERLDPEFDGILGRILEALPADELALLRALLLKFQFSGE